MSVAPKTPVAVAIDVLSNDESLSERDVMFRSSVRLTLADDPNEHERSYNRKGKKG